MGITPLELEDPAALRMDFSESKKRERAKAGVRAAMEASQALKATHTFRAFDDGTNPMFMMVHEVGGGCDFDPPCAASWVSTVLAHSTPDNNRRPASRPPATGATSPSARRIPRTRHGSTRAPQR